MCIGKTKSIVILPQHRIPNVYSRLERMFQDSVVGFEDSENLIVVRTLPGTLCCASCIDNITWKEILGTIAVTILF